MSYYATFKPTKEAIDKLKESDPFIGYRSSDSKGNVEESKFALLQLCMKNPENLSTKSALFTIKLYLKMIQQAAIHDCINGAIEQFESEEEIYYCGWDKAKRECQWEEESTTQHAVEDLMMMTFLVDTKDYYNQDEHEDFYEKYNRIQEIIDDYYQSIYDWYIFEVMKKLVDYRTGEDLGDNTWWKKKETVKEESIEESND